MKGKEGRRPSESFILGVVALVFLIIGYQTAMFIYRASVMKIVAGRDEPDTVYVYERAEPLKDSVPPVRRQTEVIRKSASHSQIAEAVRENQPRRHVETFRFNPNTASEDDLCRLGFSPKQARSIIGYRQKGGRFSRKSDFARSFVVSDSIYRRLEPYIDIPLLDLNLADSTAFDALPGIGGWFASRIIEHRKALKGFSYKEQLMDIQRFDREKYESLKDLIVVDPANQTPYPLWTYPVDSLRLHPYIGNYETARAIVLFRENTPRSEWSIEKISAAGILDDSAAEKLSGCSIIEP